MKHQQNHRRAATGFVTLSGLVLGLVLAGQYEPSAAIANDDKVFAPQFCVPVEGTDNTFDNDAEFQEDRLELTEDGQVICPLVRDIIKGDLDTVWVRLDNMEKGQGSEDTECCVIAYDPLGESSEEECEEADEGDDLQTLEIQGPDSEDNGYYVVTCDLEDEEAILSIRTSESDDNN